MTMRIQIPFPIFVAAFITLSLLQSGHAASYPDTPLETPAPTPAPMDMSGTAGTSDGLRKKKLRNFPLRKSSPPRPEASGSRNSFTMNSPS